jgi:malonate decarboxylase epsilon subunit
MTIAYLFPGQGSQRPGMLHALPDHPEARATLQEASDILHQDAYGLDEAQVLESTIATQIAVYIAGVAAARALIAESVEPDAVAGLSVGAFTAATVSGALAFKDGLPLVRKRAELTAECFPSGYGLAAIVGLDEQQVLRLVAECSTPEQPVFVGNINAPRQIVVAGSLEGMDRVLALARPLGATKAERLAVRIPSHCPLFEGVAQQLIEAMKDLPQQRPRAQYVTNRRARPTRVFDRIREDIATNIAHSVRWYDSTQVLVEMGTTLFVELHPGHVLTGLATEAFPQVKSVAFAENPMATVLKLVRGRQDGPNV